MIGQPDSLVLGFNCGYDARLATTRHNQLTGEGVKQFLSFSATRKLRRRKSKPYLTNRKSYALEPLEGRQLLAGDLVGRWLADSLGVDLSDGDTVSTWIDSHRGLTATSEGNPTWIDGRYGGRSALHFDPSDGDDLLVVERDESPVANATDFSVVVAFATSSTDLAGEDGPWFQNTGIVDGSNLGIARDWGISINHSGQLTAGVSGGFGGSAATVTSTLDGLNDGQLHVAAFTKSGSTISLYVDQQAVVTRDDADAAARANLGFTMGRLFSKQQPYSGDIAEVRIYDGALDRAEAADVVSEVRSHFNNTAPLPVDDQYTLAEDTTFFLINPPGVLQNDTDADGDPLTAEIVDAPSHGTLVFQPTGSFVYNVERNFFGTDTFTYRALDFRASETQS